MTGFVVCLVCFAVFYVVGRWLGARKGFTVPGSIVVTCGRCDSGASATCRCEP